MVFSYRNNITLKQMKFNGIDIECVRSTWYIGLIFDSNLNFNSHADIISKKMS